MEWRDKVDKGSARGDKLKEGRLKAGVGEEGKGAEFSVFQTEERSGLREERQVEARGGAAAERGGARKMLWNSASPVAPHAAAVSIERTGTRLKKTRGQITQ